MFQTTNQIELNGPFSIGTSPVTRGSPTATSLWTPEKCVVLQVRYIWSDESKTNNNYVTHKPKLRYGAPPYGAPDLSPFLVFSGSIFHIHFKVPRIPAAPCALPPPDRLPWESFSGPGWILMLCQCERRVSFSGAVPPTEPHSRFMKYGEAVVDLRARDLSCSTIWKEAAPMKVLQCANVDTRRFPTSSWYPNIPQILKNSWPWLDLETLEPLFGLFGGFRSHRGTPSYHPKIIFGCSLKNPGSRELGVPPWPGNHPWSRCWRNIKMSNCEAVCQTQISRIYHEKFQWDVAMFTIFLWALRSGLL